MILFYLAQSKPMTYCRLQERHHIVVCVIRTVKKKAFQKTGGHPPKCQIVRVH